MSEVGSNQCSPARGPRANRGLWGGASRPQIIAKCLARPARPRCCEGWAQGRGGRGPRRSIATAASAARRAAAPSAPRRRYPRARPRGRCLFFFFFDRCSLSGLRLEPGA